MNSPSILRADLTDSFHQQAIIQLTNAYACDVMGGQQSLSPQVLENLIPGLQKHPTTIIFLAFIDSLPIGIATCFLGFSTFAAKPLINIHDLAVMPKYRGLGVGRALLEAVESLAAELDCAKLTLEVVQNNLAARSLYESVGFQQANYGEQGGGALFYSKFIRSS